MPVSNEDHQALVLWAADCAQRILACFERERPEDDRPQKALEAGRVWVRGDLRMMATRSAAFAAHSEVDRVDDRSAREQFTSRRPERHRRVARRLRRQGEVRRCRV